MNRKQLTATQILRGARAYSHNASRRAHQLSGPKRVRVMHGPVASHEGLAINASWRDNDGERPCECGYSVCAKRGPCAPQVTPKPSARALDNLPAEPSPAGGRPLKTTVEPGDRFFIRDYGDKLNGTTQTVASIVEHRKSDGSYGVRFVGVPYTWGVHPSKPYVGIEPAPSPVSEAPTAESDEAVLKRAGFTATGNTRVGDARYAGHEVYLGPSECRDRVGQWFVNHLRDYNKPNIYAPTLLQAACAALGITLLDNDDHLDRDPWEAYLDGEPFECGPDAESCARAALEAWSRREEPAS